MTPFDCELIHAGWPAQPINSISALAFVVAAAVLWRRQRHGVAVLASAVGTGSAWFHSDPSQAASWAHDVSLYALVAVAAIEVWRALAARRPPVLAGAIFATGLVVWFFSRTGGALCTPGSVVQGHAIWHVMAATAAVVLFSKIDPSPSD